MAFKLSVAVMVMDPLTIGLEFNTSLPVPVDVVTPVPPLATARVPEVMLVASCVWGGGCGCGCQPDL